MTKEEMKTGFSGAVACKAVGITYRQLDYWARTKLVVPSISGAKGYGSQRLYSFEDTALLGIVKKLLNAGVSLQQIRKALDNLKKRNIDDISKITLMSDGSTVYYCKNKDEIYDIVAGGQGVFGITIGNVLNEVEGKLKHLPKAIEIFRPIEGGKSVTEL